MEKNYTYNGKIVATYSKYKENGRFHSCYSTPLGEDGLQQLLDRMPVYDKVHMSRRAYGVLKALECHNIDPQSRFCIDNAEIMDYILRKDIRGASQLKSRDPVMWQLAKKRGLLRGIQNLVDGK